MTEADWQALLEIGPLDHPIQGPPSCPICLKMFGTRPCQINGVIVCTSCYTFAMKLERLLRLLHARDERNLLARKE